MCSSIGCRQNQCVGMILLILCMMLTWGIPVYAKNSKPPNAFRVDPAFVEIDTLRDPPGKQIPIHYMNKSTQPVRVDLSFLPVTFGSEKVGMSFPIKKSILSFHVIPSANTFLIEPGETSTILLSLTDLDLLTKTDYYEALSAHVSTQTPADSTQGASVSSNITTLLLVRNGGADAYPIYAFEKGTETLSQLVLSYPPKLTFRLSNTGKTYGMPRGIVTITDMWGREVSRGAINTDSVRIFPGSIRLLDVQLLSEGFPLPAYVAKYSIDLYDVYAQEKTRIHEEHLFLFIDPIFGTLILVVAPMYVIFLIYASKVSKQRKTMDSAPRASNDRTSCVSGTR